MSEEKKDFVVKDRRIFAGDGEQSDKSPDEKKPEPEQHAEEAPEKQKAADKAQAAASEEAHAFDGQLPEINFLTFIMSLNASALVNLGMVEDPASQSRVKNLPLAKQTIDIMGMLQEKTQGNLSEDEANLLKHVLYELRMIYVKEKK